MFHKNLLPLREFPLVLSEVVCVRLWSRPAGRSCSVFFQVILKTVEKFCGFFILLKNLHVCVYEILVAAFVSIILTPDGMLSRILISGFDLDPSISRRVMKFSRSDFVRLDALILCVMAILLRLIFARSHHTRISSYLLISFSHDSQKTVMWSMNS